MTIARNLLIAVALAAGSTSTIAYAHPALPTDNSIADVAERVVESVVNISTEAEVQVDPFFSGFFGGDSGGGGSCDSGGGGFDGGGGDCGGGSD